MIYEVLKNTFFGLNLNMLVKSMNSSQQYETHGKMSKVAQNIEAIFTNRQIFKLYL